MKMLWLVLVINGVVEAYTPVGRVSMKACEEYAARMLIETIVQFKGRATYRCVTR
jgi:hypothetical protein